MRLVSQTESHVVRFAQRPRQPRQEPVDVSVFHRVRRWTDLIGNITCFDISGLIVIAQEAPREWEISGVVKSWRIAA
jgi:hypothetical protein